MCERRGFNDDKAPSILGRVVDQHPRASSFTSLASWLAAVVVLVLHANGTAVRSVDAFMLGDSWLIGTGCIGLPVFVLDLLGRHLTSRIMELIAAVCFTGAALVTVFVGTGVAHMQSWTATFLLILFLAMGIQSLNGAYAQDRLRRAVEQARAEERAKRDEDVQAAYLAALIAIHQTQEQRAAEDARILERPTEEIVGLQAALDNEMESRRARHLDEIEAHGNAQVLHLFDHNHARNLPPSRSGSD